MATDSRCRGGTGAVQRAAQVDWIGLDWIELEGGCRRRDVLVDMRLAEKRSVEEEEGQYTPRDILAVACSSRRLEVGAASDIKNSCLA